MTDTQIHEDVDDFVLGEDQANDPPENDGHEIQDGEVVGFGGEETSTDDDTPLVRQLRRELRDRNRQLNEQRRAPETETLIEVGERPRNLEDFDYDGDAFNAAVDAWDQRRIARAEQDDRIAAQKRKQEDEWAVVTRGYAESKSKLRFADRDEAEARAFDELSNVQQAVIAKLAPDPALLVYALGKSPAKLAALAAIEDPLKLAHEIGKMGATLTVTKRSPQTQPERIVRGQPIRTGSADKELERLEKEAERSGDRSKVITYKRNLRENGK